MSALSAKLRRADKGHIHWCPGCQERHFIPDSWTFNGDIEKPTFTPSVNISANYGPLAKKPGPYCCHYNLTAGVLQYHGDCSHAMAGTSVPLPDMPENVGEF